jgi:D-alanyl-D-alanine endopeptidase (penicillin-binding protein 7)
MFAVTSARAETGEPRAEVPPPKLDSPFAIVIDAATGAELYARNADEVRPIASMTKIFVAMALRKQRLELDKWTEITHADAVAATGGAPTRLALGQVFQNRDLLAAMLMVSDNRVPSALARSVGLSQSELLAKMRTVAKDLGLTHTKFDDATGILGNESTAREMALALRQTLRDPVMRRYMTTRYARVISQSEDIVADYKSTVSPLWDKRYRIRGGKTGWTEEAGYCLIISAEIGERTVVMAFLGAKHKDARYGDFAKVAEWLDSGRRTRS